MADVLLLDMPMDVGLEFAAFVRLHDRDPKRPAPANLVNEPDRRALVAGVVHLEDANPGAVVDGRELI